MEVHPDDDIFYLYIVVILCRCEQQFCLCGTIPCHAAILVHHCLLSSDLLAIRHAIVALQAETNGLLFQQDAYLYIWLFGNRSLVATCQSEREADKQCDGRQSTFLSAADKAESDERKQGVHDKKFVAELVTS